MTAMPLLEELRHHVAPTWLWDAARGRIVWANAAGIAAFDCDTLFDLIDRPFDMREPGVEAVVELSRRLVQGEGEAAELMFPSTGSNDAYKSMTYLHPLADGRAGVLVVVDAPPQPVAAVEAPEPPVQIDHYGFLLEAMPQCAAICDSGFLIVRSNTALQKSFVTTESLAALLGNAERFDKTVLRLLNNAVTSSIETLDSVNGPRDFRVTLSKMDTGDGQILLLLEDVTERRKLERRLSSLAEVQPEPATRNAPVFTDPAQVMAEIGRQLSHSLNAGKTHAAVPVAEAPVFADATNIPEPIRQTLEQSAAAIAICQQGKPVYITQKALALFGHATRGEAAAQSALWAALQEVRPGGQHFVTLPNGARVSVSCMPMPWQNGRAEQFTFHAVAESGKPRAELITETKSAPVQPDVAKPAVIAEAPIATAPQGLQDELQAILDVVSDGIVTLSAEGEILSFSAGAEAIFGVQAGETIGRPLAELLVSESRKTWRDYLRSLAGPGLGAVFNDGREMLAQHKQGGQLPLFISVGRVQSPQSKAAYCAVVRDISPWKKTERELTEAKEKAEQANRRKSDFLAHISHELRTPLNAIMGFSDVMRTERLGPIKNEKYLAYANDIHASGSHLLAIVNDILDLARVEAGKLELNFTAINLEDVADYVLRLTRESASAANVIVRRSFPQGLPRVVGDLKSLRQVMLNLVSNAIKFTDAGGEVLISAQLDNSGTLALRVKDTGVGMSKAELESALKPFGRVEDAARPRPGTGLGLPLTKSLVEANRAQLDLHSEPGRGTLAEITFPGPRVLVE